MGIRGNIILFITLLYSLALQAQEPSYTEYNTSHGLAQNQAVAFFQDSDACIWIGLLITEKGTETIVQDDSSVGYNEYECRTNSTGKGLSIAKRLFDIFNHYNEEKIIFHISDLSDGNGKAAGTRVIVSIPDNYDFFTFNKRS